MKCPKSICVVGGGTAGFVTALILKKSFPNFTIDLIESSKLGIIGVGEGSTEHWNEFAKFMNIDKQEMLKACDATFKAGIMFENWSETPYMQTVEGAYSQKYHEYPAQYADLHLKDRPLVSPEAWNSEVLLDDNFKEAMDEFPVVQFHFNTHKLNEYLHSLADKFNITVFDDTIIDVETKDGEIATIKSSLREYKYDFYIDSTGFRKVLIGELGAQWQSYSEYLKMNSAIVFPTGDEEEYPMWTLARAMDAGWMFRIPVWGRKGNGYIFDKNYITVDEAKAEVEKYLGHEIEIGKHIEFDPGCLDRVWIGNCVAVGLSASFVEPLEATSIGTSIQQAFMLVNRLVNYNQTVIDVYNQEVEEILLDIRDFIALHYITERRDTPFWKDVSEMPLPPNLKKWLPVWKNRMPIESDFGGEGGYKLFGTCNYLLVLAGLNLFNNEQIKTQFDLIPDDIKNLCELNFKAVWDEYNKWPKIPHKEFINLVRKIR
jgi:tryptophan halogenase